MGTPVSQAEAASRAIRLSWSRRLSADGADSDERRRSASPADLSALQAAGTNYAPVREGVNQDQRHWVRKAFSPREDGARSFTAVDQWAGEGDALPEGD